MPQYEWYVDDADRANPSLSVRITNAPQEGVMRLSPIALPSFRVGDRIRYSGPGPRHGEEGAVVHCFLANGDYTTAVSWDNPTRVHSHEENPNLERIQDVPEVGTTNNELQGGEEMPETITIPVRHTQVTRSRVFDSLGIRASLLNDLDLSRWQAALENLNESLGSISWQILPGSFRMPHYPQTSTGDQVETASLDDVNAFLSVATGGRLQMSHLEGAALTDAQYLTLIPVHPVERAAYQRYAAGNSTYVQRIGDDYLVELYDLRHLLDNYGAFARGPRKELIRAELQRRMAESSVKGATKQPAPKWDTKRVEGFAEFLRGVKSRLIVEPQPLEHLPILPNKTLSSRTWGIEIEAVDIRDTRTPAGWQLKGDGSLRGLSSSSLPSRMLDPEYTPVVVGDETPALVVPTAHTPSCEVVTPVIGNFDCNCGFWDYLESAPVASNRGSGSKVGEWNSPILRSFHSRGLKHLTDEIEFRDTNNSAGIHVHVAAADLTPAQAMNLSIIYTALEPLFQSAYMRGEDRTYCKEVDVAELVTRFKASRNLKDQGATSAAGMVGGGNRYWTVNLASLSSHGTIEFRAMGPVYNYNHLVRWAYLVRELVNVAKADVPQAAWGKVRTIKDLVVLFSKYGKETPTPEWAVSEPVDDELAKILESLGTDNRRLPHSVPLLTNPRYNMVNDDYSSASVQFSDNLGFDEDEEDYEEDYDDEYDDSDDDD